MPAAIVDQRRNPIGISGRGGTTRVGVGRKYRDCDLDDSYAESFRASYALGPPANSSEGSCSAGDFFCFPNARLEFITGCTSPLTDLPGK